MAGLLLASLRIDREQDRAMRERERKRRQERRREKGVTMKCRLTSGNESGDRGKNGVSQWRIANLGQELACICEVGTRS
jgi:hypothetical protein